MLKIIQAIFSLLFLIKDILTLNHSLTQIESLLISQNIQYLPSAFNGLTTSYYDKISLNLTLNEDTNITYISFDTRDLTLDKFIISNMSIIPSRIIENHLALITVNDTNPKGTAIKINTLIIENSLIEVNLFPVYQINTLQIQEIVIINSKFNYPAFRINCKINSTINSFSADISSILLSPFPLIQVQSCPSSFINNTVIPHSYLNQYPYSPTFIEEIKDRHDINLITLNHRQISQQNQQYQQQKTLIENTSSKNLTISNATVDFGGNYIRFLLSPKSYGIVKLFDSDLSNTRAYSDGGAVLGLNTKLYIKNVNFINCKSKRFGGAVKVYVYDIQDTTFFNCSGVIGGAIFTTNKLGKTDSRIDNVTYTNNSASITGNDIFILGIAEKSYSYQFLQIDQILQYSSEVKGTQFESVEIPYQIKQTSQPYPYNEQLQVELTAGFLHIIKFKFQSINQTEFTKEQAVGNLYDLLLPKTQVNFSPIELADIYYPYLVLQYNEQLDCLSHQEDLMLFIISYFRDEKIYEYKSGCMTKNIQCSSSMIIKSVGQGCSYCSLGTRTIDQEVCLPCNNKLYDQCFANISILKSSLWRSSLTSSDHEIYSCNLNSQSCEGDKRNGIGNELCSEGYIGIQCTSCDINGDYWGDSYGEIGEFQCMKCSLFVQNKRLFMIVSMCFTLLLLAFTLVSNFKRMQRQIIRSYLSKMKLIYVGSSFLRKSQMAVYIKIMLFNFQIYMTTYYFINFNKSDDISFHSQFYSFFNPLQNSSSSSLQCLMKEYFPDSSNLNLLKLQITMIIPFVVNGVVIFILLCFVLCKIVRWNTLIYVSSHCIGYTILFVWIQPILQQSIASHQCIHLTQEDQYLILDRQINCSDNNQMAKFHDFSIPAIIVYVIIIPLAYFIGLVSQRKKLEKIRTLRLFGFLYDEYKRKYYFWQFIKIFLSQLLTAILQLSKTKSIFVGLVYCGLLTVYLIMLIQFVPFQQLRINKMEITSIFLSILYLLSSLSIDTAYNIEDNYEANSVSSKVSNIFYYSVLICLAIFYVYMAIMILSFIFELGLAKLQRFRIFAYLSRCFPSLFQVQNLPKLRKNLQIWRQKVKELHFGEMKPLKGSEYLSTYSFFSNRSTTIN